MIYNFLSLHHHHHEIFKYDQIDYYYYNIVNKERDNNLGP